MPTLRVQNLKAEIDGKPILRGIDLEIRTGEIAALMGPNGSGKSTLAHILMGHPRYTITEGSIFWDDIDLLSLEVHERARLGLFLAFQYPVEIPGVTVGKFLKRAVEIRHEQAGTKFAFPEFLKQLRADLDFLEMDQNFINRYLNEGFSGGEKKRMEILQMLTLRPKIAVFDETDSGLDIDALKIVSKGINRMRGPDFGGLIITHYQRILNHVRPDVVHIMYKGKIVTSGREDLVQTLEEKGYDWVKAQYGIEEAAYVG